MPDTHDKRYKKLFSNPVLVQELLQSFIHEDFVDRLEYPRMELLDKSFITGCYSRLEADMIWRIPLEGAPVYIYLLLEFQSTVDRFLSLRMLRYLCELHDFLRKREKLRFLPPV